MSRRAGIPTPSERRARVAELAPTHTRAQLADKLDVHVVTIDADLRVLDVHAKPDSAVPPQRAAARDERRARLAQLAATHTRRELAETLDVSLATIQQDLRALNLQAKRGTTARPDLLARRAERRARLRELAAKHTRRELTLILGAGPEAIRNDLEALGITAKPAPRDPGPRPAPPEMLARREQVRQLAPTHTQRELLELLGMARQTLTNDLKALGVRAKPASRRHSQAKRLATAPDTPPTPSTPTPTPTPTPARVGPRPQAKWCPKHPGVRVGAWGCRACNAQLSERRAAR